MVYGKKYDHLLFSSYSLFQKFMWSLSTQETRPRPRYG